MDSFFKFMASPIGRLVRIVAGVILIAVGLWAVKGTAGIIVAIIGLLPLAAGVFDVCLFAPLFGKPFSGSKIRGGK